MNYSLIKIKTTNQKYFFDMLKKYPNIKSGRKNYSFHHKRIMKNILLSKMYKYNNDLFYKNIILKKNNDWFKITIINS